MRSTEGTKPEGTKPRTKEKLGSPLSHPELPLAFPVLLAVVIVNGIGFGVVVPLLPFYGTMFHAAAWQITLLFASFSAGQFVGELILGRLSDHIGRRPIILATVLSAIVGFLALAAAPTIWLAIAARAVCGFCSGNISTLQAYVADVTPTERLAGRLGLIGAATGVGFVVGPTLGGLLARPELGLRGFQHPILVAAALSALAALGTFMFLREYSPATTRRVGVIRLHIGLRNALTNRISRLLLAVTFVSFVGWSILWAVMGLWGEQLFGWGPREMGTLMGCVGVLMALSQGSIVSPAVAKFGAQRAIMLSLSISACSLVLLACVAVKEVAIAALVLAMMAHALSQPPTSALISRTAAMEAQGSILGANAATGALGRILGPVLGGILFSASGATAPFVLAAMAMAVAVYFAWESGRAK